MKRLDKRAVWPAALLLMSATIASPKPAAAFQEAVFTGPAPYGPPQLAQYQTWLGSTGVWAEDFEASTSWGEIEDAEWLYGPWGTWEQNNPNGNILIGVPLIPGDGSTLAAGASGAYNSHFTTMCSNMQRFGLTRAILRVGWEMNLGYTKWNAAQDQAHWVPAFQQAANTIHAYNTAHGTSYKVCWNPSNGWDQQATDQDWNGLSSQYVDYIGVDVYDDYPHGGNGSQNEYANTSNTTYQPTAAQQAQAWTDFQDNYGLSYYTSLSQSTGIPLIVPEWGVWGVNEGRPAGGDDPAFIQNMYNWFKANNIQIECYFDVYAADGDHQLWPGPNGNTVSEFPLSKAKYLSLFTNNGGSPAVPAAPANLTAAAGSAQVAISWNGSSGATSYNVYRGTAAGGESSTAIATGVTTLSFTNTGLTNGTTYYYKVKAVNSSGSSGYSNEASATPTAAVNLVANGTYTIVNRMSGLAIDDPAWSGATGVQMEQYTINGQTNQKWVLTNLGSNYVKLTNAFNGLALSVGSNSNGAAVVQNTYTGANTQIWQIQSAGSGYYALINKSSGLALDNPGGSTASGTLLDQFTYGGGWPDHWKFQ